MSASPPVPPSGREVRVWLAAAVTVLAWASAFVGIRFAGPHLDPGPLTVGRLLVGSAVLSVIVGLRRARGHRLVRPARRDVLLILLVGVAWFGVYNVALNAGERHVDAGTAAMLIQVAPVLVAVLAGLALGEGFPRSLVVGGLVAFAGTLVIGVATARGAADPVGVLLVLLAAVVYAGAMVAQKVALARVPGLQLTWLACLVGTVVTLPFLPAMVRQLATAPGSVLAAVVYLGAVPTALAFSTWAYALARTTAGRLGVTTYLVPPVAIGLGWLLLGETPPPLAVAGGLLSLLGVALTRRR